MKGRNKVRPEGIKSVDLFKSAGYVHRRAPIRFQNLIIISIWIAAYAAFYTYRPGSPAKASQSPIGGTPIARNSAVLELGDGILEHAANINVQWRF